MFVMREGKLTDMTVSGGELEFPILALEWKSRDLAEVQQ